jgi:putative ABC transport system ATP-binding protein
VSSSAEIRDVTLAFGTGPARMLALNGVHLGLRGGTFTVVCGPSGSGKTSLLSVIGAMLSPDSGSIFIEDTDILALGDKERTAFRREKIGYVFQSFRLMPGLTAEENIRLSLEVRRVESGRRRALEALDTVGLVAKAHLRPNQMSGGEQQRVAVARAIAHSPMMLLADEPTASLDTANGQQVTRILADLARDPARIVVVVTHDPRILPSAGRLVQMQDGRVVEDRACLT